MIQAKYSNKIYIATVEISLKMEVELSFLQMIVYDSKLCYYGFYNTTCLI